MSIITRLQSSVICWDRQPARARFALRSALIAAALLVFVFACDNISAATAPEAEPTETSADITPQPTARNPMDESLVTRTPEPTATPGPLARTIDRVTTQAGMNATSFLGLTTANWINLGLSLLFVVLAYALGTWLLRSILLPVVRRTPTKLDDMSLETVGPDLRWLVVVLALQLATSQLGFISADLKQLLADVYFFAALLIAALVAWRLVSLAQGWFRERADAAGRAQNLEPVIKIGGAISRVAVVVLGSSVMLTHLGINLTPLVAVIGIGVLALSLAAQDTIKDTIAGFIILIDQPFRLGDRIQIEKLGEWGDVVEIGLRTTRIQTMDHRLVIIPNSVISTNQVVNYTYPDPRYRIQTHVSVAYGTDIKHARQVIIDAVRQVDDVLLDKPVDALYIEMGTSAMVFRVRWWIESYVDSRRVLDSVHSALQEALDAAGIEMPYQTQDLNVRLMPETADTTNREEQNV
jgi:MscS family membrane protein